MLFPRNTTGQYFINDDIARFIMGVLLWILVVEIVTALLFFEIPQANRELMIALAGALVGALTATNSYYNKTGIDIDRKKDETISRAVETAASIQAQNNPITTIPVTPGEVIAVTAVGVGNEPTNGNGNGASSDKPPSAV